MKTFQLPENPVLVVASDVHIRSQFDDRYRLLCQLVNEAQRVSANTFVLNGDIFDFFFAWGPYFCGKFQSLFLLLDQLAKSGTNVWFVEGNHEFGLEQLAAKYRIHVVPGEGALWHSPTYPSIWIAHGDLMKKDFWYNLYRSVVRNPVTYCMALIVPQLLLDRGTSWFASTSRKKDKYRTLNHDRILKLAQQKLDLVGCKNIIFGHFHHPYDATLPDGRRILSVSSWDQPSCLVMTGDGKFSRISAE